MGLLASVSAQAGASPVGPTAAIDTTGASLIIAIVSDDGSVVQGNVTDSKGVNQWNKLGTSTNATRTCLFYTIPVSVGTGHTFTYTNGQTFQNGTLWVCAWSGFGGLDGGTQGNAATNTSIQATAGITPSAAGALIITGVARYVVNPTITIDGGFTIGGSVNYNGAIGAIGCDWAYLIQGSAAVANPTWNFNGTTMTSTTRLGAFSAQAPANIYADGGILFKHA